MAGVCARAVLGTPISAHPQAGDVRGPPPWPRCGRGHSPGLSGASFLPARVGRGRRASERSARDGRRASPAAVARGSLRGSVRRGASPPPGSGFQNSPAEPASATLGFATGARHCFRGAPSPEVARRVSLVLPSRPSWGPQGEAVFQSSERVHGFGFMAGP